MKIGMILDAKFPPDPRVENEAISLINGRHEVFLFCLSYESEKSSEIINGIQVKRYQSNKLEYKLSALAYTVPFYTYLMKNKINKFVKDTEIEALHIHDIRIAQAVFNANKNYSLPVVLDLHDNMPEVMKLYPHLQKFPGKYIISPSKSIKLSAPSTISSINFWLILFAFNSAKFFEIIAGEALSFKRLSLMLSSSTLDGSTLH